MNKYQANNDKKNILLLSLRADYGGGPEHIWQLVNKSSEKSNFFIACPKDKPYWSRYIGLLSIQHLCELPHRQFKLGALIKLIKFIHIHQIQLIHTHGKGAGIYGRLSSLVTKIPCIHTPHGIHVGSYGLFKKALYRLYENISAYKLKHIFFVSKSEQEQAKIIKLWASIPNTVINNGVNSIKHEQSIRWRKQLRKKLNVSDKTFLIATLSRFDYPKNMYEAYEITKQCPNLVFIWIGDGEDKKILEEKSKNKGVHNIIFTGFTDTPSKFLAASDVYLSTSRWEGMPLGVLEAMASGLPVIASDVAGNCDVVQEGVTGFRYPLGDTRKASGYLNLLSKNTKLYNKLSNEALHIQKNEYSVQTMAQKIQTIYKEIIND